MSRKHQHIDQKAKKKNPSSPQGFYGKARSFESGGKSAVCKAGQHRRKLPGIDISQHPHLNQPLHHRTGKRASASALGSQSHFIRFTNSLTRQASSQLPTLQCQANARPCCTLHGEDGMQRDAHIRDMHACMHASRQVPKAGLTIGGLCVGRWVSLHRAMWKVGRVWVVEPIKSIWRRLYGMGCRSRLITRDVRRQKRREY